MKAIKFLPLIALCKLAFSMNTCGNLQGSWQGNWTEPSSMESTTVIFTSIHANKFKGYYYSNQSPQNKIKFAGLCLGTPYGYLNLAFKPVPPQPQDCTGILDNGSLWMGCPYVEQGGIFTKQ